MIKKLNQTGVTIVEVMIVLSIIALVFTITFRVFDPFFNKETFRQSANLFAADINDALNDTRTGVFPNYEGVRCNGNLADEVVLIRGAFKPGNYDDCILLGKAIQLGVDGTVTEEDDKYWIHTLIGLADKNEKAFERVEIFNNRTLSPEFTTSLDKTVPQGGLIKMAYLDENLNGEYDATPSPGEPFLDGFAVIIDSFGERNDTTTTSFIGGSRNIIMKAAYLDAGAANDNRPRANLAAFETRTKGHRRPPPSTNAFYKDVDYPIIICLHSGTGEEGIVRVGSQNGTLQALVDLDPVRAEDACRL